MKDMDWELNKAGDEAVAYDECEFESNIVTVGNGRRVMEKVDVRGENEKKSSLITWNRTIQCQRDRTTWCS